MSSQLGISELSKHLGKTVKLNATRCMGLALRGTIADARLSYGALHYRVDVPNGPSNNVRSGWIAADSCTICEASNPFLTSVDRTLRDAAHTDVLRHSIELGGAQ